LHILVHNQKYPKECIVQIKWSGRLLTPQALWKYLNPCFYLILLCTNAHNFALFCIVK
jgi:hypothetical protein